ncbi:quinone-dependent dihydroorotate dehydrogenase [Cryobacterium sp. TMT1-21]|uniref:Dihydroorotate dehydrogenase (quinone) n=1 Tax=Cryobacterium shii TaxID=1259235 RepID=A0AAQ2C5Y6_9MICO|nr:MULTISPECIES: quinone-dependent dihydroorotate dehydrogenase [Cryobacterium]TFC45861.1 quinone-dependent dihydroorotate dehydrogenase [Cryobacterium shii]TFC84422.1 quinone-dependent dihydroorotate dehydrogenase [Cryobacterium sp. TmT2-59]TFD08725.1 quinone-dependent dihydroorotate dehydrogenase [Cryobacterium sp. TMT1-21]TFD18514.1 quinone-dependent dihydroorotate dehydrogenase [Cryobacterium sp. TMT4-10]TFD26298.1 quinone-dependent dihydroorotate dehydrogenase [Cryobacterium sp. TMT2-23]
MYPLVFSLFFARLDPERAHHLAFSVIRAVPALGFGRLVHRFTRPRTDLGVDTLGLHFASPFGLAAGFDKDGKAVIGLGQLGFGHVEVGTITAVPQPGNPTPRLFRLIPDRAVINRMGFNNDGARAARVRLSRVRAVRGRPVLGINIGKSRVTPVEDATADYLASAALLAPLADYLVVNVSSPNTPGLRGLQELDQLAPLLRAVKAEAGATPLLVKIAPDLSDDEVTRIAELSVSLGLDGIIATNTTLSRDGLKTDAAVVLAAGAGGLSGAPLHARSLAVLRLIRASVPASLCVISVGGVETAEQVAERLAAGATLVQGYTGFLYRGPLWARQINRGLDRILAA